MRENWDEGSQRLAAERQRGLGQFSIGVPELEQYRQSTYVRVIGEPLGRMQRVVVLLAGLLR